MGVLTYFKKIFLKQDQNSKSFDENFKIQQLINTYNKKYSDSSVENYLHHFPQSISTQTIASKSNLLYCRIFCYLMKNSNIPFLLKINEDKIIAKVFTWDKDTTEIMLYFTNKYYSSLQKLVLTLILILVALSFSLFIIKGASIVHF